MLQPTPGRPGHWADPHWQPGTPGTFAMVIGVSRYRHLAGGHEPVPDRGQPWIREAQTLLGQLHVSTLTAVRFFEWLRRDYAYKAAPLAQCWLLLAPTEDERAILAAETDALDDAPEPTFTTCETAIREWADAIAVLPVQAQHGSRAVFFFSGHGLEVVPENQLLLPSDYLGGAAPHWDRALSTLNLRHGLDHVQVPHRFYFVDACRNDFPEIRQMQPKGSSILPPYPAAQAYRGVRAAAVLYATSSSLQAWQPEDPRSGPSLFGRALLDGLAGKPDIELLPTNGGFTVNFGKLEGFVSNRVVELLHQRGATVEQPVQPSGIVRDEVVAELERSAVLSARPAAAEPPQRSPRGEMTIADARTAVARGADTERMLRQAFTRSRTLPPDTPTDAWAGNFSTGHDLFGHESATALFSSLRLASLTREQWIDRNRFRLGRADLGETRNDHGDMVLRYRVEASVDDHDLRGHWLELEGERGVGYGVVLPKGEGPDTRYVLSLELGSRWRQVGRLEAVLAEDNPHPQLAAAARLWTRYRTADVTQAVSEFEGSELEATLRGEMMSPLAATVAALILLRADRLDLLHDWLRNLAQRFGRLPDGAVLWAEHLLRDPTKTDGDAATEAVEYLGLLEERGLPMTSEAFSYAVSLTSRLELDAAALPEGPRSRFARVKQYLSSACRFFRPGGLFTSYAHFRSQSGPADPAMARPPLSPRLDVPTGSGPEPTAGIPLPKPGSGGSIIEWEDCVDIGGVRIRKRRPT